MTAAQDAAVLYFALHGTDAPLTCQFLLEDDHESLAEVQRCGKRCGKPLAGLDHDDGCPLCYDHLQTEGGHPLDFDTVAELWMVKKTLESMQGRINPRFPTSHLEAFALKVAGIESEPRSTPRTVEARIRGHVRLDDPPLDTLCVYCGTTFTQHPEQGKLIPFKLGYAHTQCIKDVSTVETRIRGHIR